MFYYRTIFITCVHHQHLRWLNGEDIVQEKLLHKTFVTYFRVIFVNLIYPLLNQPVAVLDHAASLDKILLHILVNSAKGKRQV